MNQIEFQADDGNTYLISIDDEGEEIAAALGSNKLGTISLRTIEIGDYSASNYYYRITHLALTAPRDLGIGRRCLQYHRELFDAPLEAAPNDGIRRDDGSHLTKGGPGFIEAMRREGIVMPIGDDDPDD